MGTTVKYATTNFKSNSRYARRSVRHGGRYVQHVDPDGTRIRDSRGTVRERQPSVDKLHAPSSGVGHVPGRHHETASAI